VEGRPHGIKVNAISPTAWTPLYARAPDVTPERRMVLEKDFGTDLVAPVVVALAHVSCPFTGEVIGAAGGHVSRMFVAQTRGTNLDKGFTPEDFIAHLPEIWDEEGAGAMGLVVPGIRGSGTPVTEVPPEARRSSAPSPNPGGSPTPSAADDLVELTHRWIQSYNDQDLIAVGALLHDQVTMEHLGRGDKTTGKAAVMARLTASAAGAFPERRFTGPRRTHVAERFVLIEHTWEATAVRDVTGDAAAGEHLAMRVCTLFRFSEGLIAEYTEYG
jgi:ketosteroid isomerase-like protein